MLDTHRCTPCMMAGIGDMGPEAVYCFHMEPTYVSHLPQDFFLLCTLTVPLRHHRSTSTALLSFVRKTNHQLHYIVFSMCFSSINGLQSFVTNGCKSAFDAYKGKAAAKPKCRVPIRCVYHLLRDGCGSSMIHRASFDYPLRFIMRTVGGISAMLVIHWHGACANSDINETSSTVLKG